VLNQLQRNPARFRDLNHQLSLILPQVRWVSVQGTGPGQLEIVAWTHDPETQREDLAMPLAESGTGIGQVLAILYVVMTSERPQTIIIDEPQSFLHPGAARKLVEFLKLHSDHQYIIATHSATIIAATNPKTITLARYQDSQTFLQQLDASAEKGIQLTLSELGIRLADSFGADDILWVEGKTEEKCFPLIVEKILKRSLLGTEILSIRQTGDLESRDAKKIFEIYRNLTKGASLLPPAIAFVLDEECRNDSAKEELRKLSGGLVEFLPRRMFENYLLNSSAIAAVANSVAGFRPAMIAADEVEKLIQDKIRRSDYYCERKPVSSPTDQRRKVDAARVLEEIFSTLSEQRVSYEKVVHGSGLTEWLTQNSPADLEEVSNLLSRVLNRARPIESLARAENSS
jgi:energy-coupling factor transporter ATP-binding protein EcfA2